MTEIIFIRHGQPDYSFVTQRKFIGHGRDLGQLSERGIAMAESVSHDKRLAKAELILSSPYTRALQTAAVVSKNTGLNIKVELDLHEWLPDLSFQFSTLEEVSAAAKSCIKNRGVCPQDSNPPWEDFESVFTRAKACLMKYTYYHKIIVVAHETLIRQFSYADDIAYCEIKQVQFDADFKWAYPSQE